MKKTLFTSALACIIFMGCNNSDASVDTSLTFDSTLSKSTSTSSEAITAPTVDAAAEIQNPAITPTTDQASQAKDLNTGNVAGLNPAHGQPGHRCDISVGAPLNSAPNKPATVTNATAPQPVVSSAPPVKTAPGMNPPHGEPGHRCDISVGAPLNSAPVKPAAVTATSEQAASIVPAKKDSAGK